MRYVEGVPFRELRRRGDPGAIAQAARSAGEVLAAIGRYTFDQTGWIAPGPRVTAPLLEGADPVPRFVDLCLESATLKSRTGADLRARIHRFVWTHAAALAECCADARLAHADFNQRNLIVNEEKGRWRVVAVLDWEFAVAGSPLMDIGNFLRYDLSGQWEKPFIAGYLDAGGRLPPEWRALALATDLAATCALLADPATPGEVAAEVRDLLASRHNGFDGS